MKWKVKKYKVRLALIAKYFKRKSNGRKKHVKRLQLRKNKIQVLLPQIFSITKNRDKTLKCLNQLRDIANHKKDGIRVNASKVRFVDPAALMYLLFILREARENKIAIRGNYPKDIEAKKSFIRYGFSNYVVNNKSIYNKYCKDEDILQIIVDSMVSPEKAGKIIKFSEQAISEHPKIIKELYASLIEMMGNVCQHAYSNKHGSWYFSCEKGESNLTYTFFDTGFGIPNTVQKSLLEKVTWLPIKRESEILRSVLNGDFRTQTKEKNRGKGLPQIYNFLSSDKIIEATLMSSKGCCKINNCGIIIDNDLEYKLYGTLFIWKIRRT